MGEPAAFFPQEGFAIKDCALTSIATGRRAQNLRELREIIAIIDSDSIYSHFWGGLLRPRYHAREFKNDFANWAMTALHDLTLAERLSVIDPTVHFTVEELRQELLEVIEDHLDGSEHVPWARSDMQFHFMRSQIVIFYTQEMVHQPEDLARVIPRMSTGSVFYHFIDARSRTEGHVDDFRSWLGGFSPQYDDLRSQLAHVDPYFETLPELRDQLSRIVQDYFGGPQS